MNKILHITFLCLLCYTVSAQEYNSAERRNPESIKKRPVSSDISTLSGISSSIFKYVNFNPVRIIYDKHKNVLYLATTSGDIYELPILSGGLPGSETLLISSSEHSINHLQGLEFHNNVFYLVGNENFSSTSDGRGRVQKCILNPDNSHTWVSMVTTDIYPSSGTLYDHAFAGVCLSKNKDTLFVSSGSRTDHGEVKNSGSYAGLREVPLTAKIFGFPVTIANLLLQNNASFINSSGFLYADGTRNEFDMAINGKGHLIGLENSGDRDDPEELNWLRKGKHYGFPWRMGGNDTPMQYTPYDASMDRLVPADALTRGIFYNDPAYPPRPSGVTFVEPIKNYGPDANWLRNPSTGFMYQGAEVSTFTSHRSPLGLVFDNDSTMAGKFLGNGFMFGYSYAGDIWSGYLPTEDGGGDLCHLELKYVEGTQNYQLHTTRIATGFGNMTDATLHENVIYATEYQGAIWKVTLPALQIPVSDFSYSPRNDCAGSFAFSNLSNLDAVSFHWDFGDGTYSSDRSPVHQYNTSGTYSVKLTAINPKGFNQKTINIGGVDVNINHTSGISSGEYKSNGYINSAINLPNNVKYRAAKGILLNPGFQVGTHETFEAKIAGCN